MKALHSIAFILVIIGGLDWLLVGIKSTWNVVGMLPPTIANIVYILVGLSAVYLVVTHKATCRNCSTSPMSSNPM
jgi:uncharacterized membrane protein YuzA (DUF378 family)